MRLALLAACAGTAAAMQIAITGTNSGIGRSAARILVAQGHTVYHACRSEERAREAAEAAGGGMPMVCDLADLGSVRLFAAALSERAPELDVLCLNAGVSPSRKAETAARTKDGFEETVGVNHLGHFLLANLMEPALASHRGRLVVTASGVHDPSSPGGTVQGDPATGATLGDMSGLGAVAGGPPMANGAKDFNGAKAYHDSKLCNVLFSREASRRWGSIGVRAFNPGLITDTGLFRSAREDNFIGTAIFSFVANNVAGISVPVEVGGERLAYVATASDDEIPSGSYLSAPSPRSKAATKADGFADANVSVEARNEGVAARLWEKSAAAVGL